MKLDEIEVGKNYRMKGGALDRRVLDIIWHPEGETAHEYREVLCEYTSGARVGKTERVGLAWFAASARQVLA